MGLGLEYNFGNHYQIIYPADYHNFSAVWPIPPTNFLPSYQPPVTAATRGEHLASLFVISAVLFTIYGAYVGGAAVNSEWSPAKWNWSDPNTKVEILNCAVEGVMIPYAFFYANRSIGPDGTVIVAFGGAYLGAAAANRRWSPFGPNPDANGQSWNWTSPVTYQGAFDGMQTALWLIDAQVSITNYLDDAQLEGIPRSAFTGFTYGTGAGIVYTYVSQYNDDNYWIEEWNRIREPGSLLAVVAGWESGTRLPIGYAEIGTDLARRTTNAIARGPAHFFKDINPVSIFGVGFLSFLYTSVANKTFDFRNWDWTSFSTVEAIFNGIAFGKDLPEMVMDVQEGFGLTSRRSIQIMGQMKSSIKSLPVIPALHAVARMTAVRKNEL